MVQLQEMAIRVLLNLGELDPKDYSASMLVGALQLRHECPHVWKELLPRLEECASEELHWLYHGLAYTDPKEVAALERILKFRIGRLPPNIAFELLEHVSFIYSPEVMRESGPDDEEIGIDEVDGSDAAELASWMEEARKRFASMGDAELGKGFCDSMEDPVRLAVLDVLVPRMASRSPDDVLLFWRDLEYDHVFYEVMARNGFTLEQCSATALLQAFDAPNARWIWEQCDELLYRHIAEFKRIAGISQ